MHLSQLIIWGGGTRTRVVLVRGSGSAVPNLVILEMLLRGFVRPATCPITCWERDSNEELAKSAKGSFQINRKPHSDPIIKQLTWASNPKSACTPLSGLLMRMLHQY